MRPLPKLAECVPNFGDGVPAQPRPKELPCPTITRVRGGRCRRQSEKLGTKELVRFEPERGLVVYEESARVAATVRLPQEPLSQTHRGKELRCRASQLVRFVRLCALPFVGIEIGRRKSSSAKFRIR